VRSEIFSLKTFPLGEVTVTIGNLLLESKFSGARSRIKYSSRIRSSGFSANLKCLFSPLRLKLAVTANEIVPSTNTGLKAEFLLSGVRKTGW
jgi:hypothetical protein